MGITLDLDAYTFGIEIEFTGVTRKDAAAAVAEVVHGTVRYVNGAYREYQITDQSGRIWKIMRDSSIAPQKKVSGRIVSADDGYKCEFVSPILRYTADMPILQEVVRALRRAKGFPNNSTGVHVHIGAEKHTPQTLRNLANIIKSKELLLMKALSVNPSRMNYCKRLDDGFVSRLNKHKPETFEKFADEVYEGFGGYEYNRHQHYSSARYYLCNYHSYFTKKTLEMRLYNFPSRPNIPNGTSAAKTYGLHAGWVRTFVILSIAINNQAIHQKNASCKPTETTNEKYSFRVWLLRMGFIGEEFEVPRRLLMESLEGNMAWRYGEPTTPIIRGDADNENN